MSLFAKLKLKFQKSSNSSEAKIYYGGLKKASSSLAKNLDLVVANSKDIVVDHQFLNAIENLLITSDIGHHFSQKIMHKIEKKLKLNTVKNNNEIKNIILEAILDLVDDHDLKDGQLNITPGELNTILVVGVNGSGKTTSIAKLANNLLLANHKVLIVAADTFRAGAVKQLNIWAEKLNIVCISPKKELQDPASVVFDGIKAAYEGNYDVVIIDTAGRLQNNNNLMAELKKIYNILTQKLGVSKIETLLVLDSTTGQNGIEQAKHFKEATSVDGIILTKMDGTSKGGIILSIKDTLNIPVKFIGFGEKIDDLREFHLENYLFNLIQPIIEGDESLKI